MNRKQVHFLLTGVLPMFVCALVPIWVCTKSAKELVLMSGWVLFGITFGIWIHMIWEKLKEKNNV
jgi:hypothetical protein